MDNTYANTQIGPDGHRYPVGQVPKFDGPVRPWRGGRRRPPAPDDTQPSTEAPAAAPGVPVADTSAVTIGVVAGALPPEPVTAEPPSFADQTGRSEQARQETADALEADKARREADAEAAALADLRAAVDAAEAAEAAGNAANPALNGAQPGLDPADDPEAPSPTVDRLDELTHEQLCDVGKANGFVYHTSYNVPELRDEIRVQMADIDELPKRDLVLLAHLRGVEFPTSANSAKIRDLIKQNQES